MTTTSKHGALVQAEELKSFAIRAFEKVGVPPKHAEITADSMVLATLRGEGDHGSRLIAIWVHKIINGGTNPLTPLEVVQDKAAIGLLDAHNGIGAVAATYAMERAIAKAREHGIGWVGVRNSNSLGSAKYYAMLALPHKMVGIALTNGVPLVVPPGGLTARTGTNPFSIAVPAKSRPALVLDMATATIAYERLRIYAARGETIPKGWAINRDGAPVEDPREVSEDAFRKGGGLLPLGGYKGFGLSVMVNVLTGVFMGGAYMDGLSEFAPHNTPERDSFALAAISIEHFMPYEEFLERMDDFIRVTKDSKLLPDVDQIYLPGERGFQREQERRKNGIPLDWPTAEALRALASELAIPSIPGLS